MARVAGGPLRFLSHEQNRQLLRSAWTGDHASFDRIAVTRKVHPNGTFTVYNNTGESRHYLDGGPPVKDAFLIITRLKESMEKHISELRRLQDELKALPQNSSQLASKIESLEEYKDILDKALERGRRRWKEDDRIYNLGISVP